MVSPKNDAKKLDNGGFAIAANDGFIPALETTKQYAGETAAALGGHGRQSTRLLNWAKMYGENWSMLPCCSQVSNGLKWARVGHPEK